MHKLALQICAMLLCAYGVLYALERAANHYVLKIWYPSSEYREATAEVRHRLSKFELIYRTLHSAGKTEQEAFTLLEEMAKDYNKSTHSPIRVDILRYKHLTAHFKIVARPLLHSYGNKSFFGEERTFPLSLSYDNPFADNSPSYLTEKSASNLPPIINANPTAYAQRTLGVGTFLDDFESFYKTLRSNGHSEQEAFSLLKAIADDYKIFRVDNRTRVDVLIDENPKYFIVVARPTDYFKGELYLGKKSKIPFSLSSGDTLPSELKPVRSDVSKEFASKLDPAMPSNRRKIHIYKSTEK